MNILLMGAGHLASAIRELGHQVVTVSFARADIIQEHPFLWSFLEKRLGDFKPDLACYLDNGNLPLLIDPYNIPAASIFYAIDTYCNPWHVPWAKGFDLALSAQKDFLSLFTDAAQPAKWLPLYAPENVADNEAERDIPVSFVGTIGHNNNPDREPFLRAFRKIHPLYIKTGDYQTIFSRSRIALNQTAFGELNYRCFEAMACGAALLMERCQNGMDELFTPGENILPAFPRNDAAKAAQIAREYLAQPEKLQEIAFNGQKLVRERHSAVARARTVLAYAEELIKNDAPQQRLANPTERRAAVKTAYMMIASELGGEQLKPYRDFYFSIGK